MVYKLLLIYLFIINRISTQGCTEDICWKCFDFNSSLLFDCNCSECPPLNSECSESECNFCEDFPSINVFFHCICDTCEEKKSKGYIKLGILLGSIILGVLVISLIFYYYLKKQKKEERIRRNMNRINNIYNRNIIINITNNNNLNSERNVGPNILYSNRNFMGNNNINNFYVNDKVIHYVTKNISLDEILNNDKYLGPKKCKKEYEKYNIVCTICLEKFIENIDMVSVTPCFHLFHSKCLDIYFRKNKNAKCPNCNFDIINHFKMQT